MACITLTTNDHISVATETRARVYVFYTGGIAGISDRLSLGDNPEALQGSSDQIQLDSK
jgi:hypothetical protein